MAGTTAPPQRSGHQHPQQQGNSSRKRRNNWEARSGKSRRRSRATESKSQTAAPLPLCSVCKKIEQPKYKCPRCRSRYCSIQCCRDHKASGCNVKANQNFGAATSKYLPKEELVPKLAPPRNDNTTSDDVADEDLEEGGKITDTMKEVLQSSEWLKNELRDMGLRHIISNINGAPNVARRNQFTTKQEDELDQAKMDHPRFKHFVDKLLVTAGILELGPDVDMDVNAWLEQEQDLTPTQLALKPIGKEGTKASKEMLEGSRSSNVEGEDVTENSNDDEDESSCDESSSDDESDSSDEDS